jgi:hypothetical protein
MQFTPLERAVLDWIAERANDPALAAQLRSAQPTAREFTGVGSFTSLRVPDDAAPVSLAPAPVTPHIESPDLEAGAGAVLFFENGRATTLELYTYGSAFPRDLMTWTLKAADTTRDEPR